MKMRIVASIVLLACLAAAVFADSGDVSTSGLGATGYNSPRRAVIPNRFDYIVIGSGPAGCAVAARLSENPDNKVLLLERGSDTSNQEFLDVPRNWDKTAVSVADHFTMIDWRKEPVVSWNEAKARASQGFGLGGTSLINAEMFVRGHKEDYNRWASVHGATGWDWDNVLPFFKKLENNPSKFASNPSKHGNNGPLHVTPGTEAPANDLALVAAAAAYGIPFNPDHNSGDQTTSALGGIAFHDMTILNGTRQNAYKSYIVPNLARPNLWVVDSAWVTKINFVRRRAVSVTWLDTLEQRYVTSRASNEIVLSAGGIGTPKLLQLSGVGNAADLGALGIDVVIDKPGVGKNLMDHPITNLGGSTFLPHTSELDTTPAAYAQWQANKTGVYSSIGGRSVIFLRTKYQNLTNDPRPDIEVIGGTPGDSIFGAIYLALPKSRGYVKIHANNPFVEPYPVGNYFSEYTDVLRLCESFRMLQSLWSHLPNGGVYLWDGSKPSNITDDSSCYSYINGFAPWTVGSSNTGNHWSGTAKIGPANDVNAVVDPRLRVYGLTGLRVADASVFPDIPSANTQAAAYMVGEKAAAMILEDN